MMDEVSTNELRLDRGHWEIIIPTMIKAQRDLTASIKDKKWVDKLHDEQINHAIALSAANAGIPERIEQIRAECQKRVEGIFREMDEDCPHVHHVLPHRPKRACDECWQALKEQEGVK